MSIGWVLWRLNRLGMSELRPGCLGPLGTFQCDLLPKPSIGITADHEIVDADASVTFGAQQALSLSRIGRLVGHLWRIANLSLSLSLSFSFSFSVCLVYFSFKGKMREGNSP